MFNPLELAKRTEEVVCRDLERKYYRFRPALFYGGIATADVVGCCLRCKFCWAWNVLTSPERARVFYSPEQVAKKLTSIAKSRGYTQLRISGNEPTIGKEHLLAVLDLIPSNYIFILETNGILIDEDYASELGRYKNLRVRVSLKADNPETFEKVTGARAEFFERPFQALKYLEQYNVSCHPSVVIDCCRDINGLKKKLKGFELEIEELIPEYTPKTWERFKGTL